MIPEFEDQAAVERMSLSGWNCSEEGQGEFVSYTRYNQKSVTTNIVANYKTDFINFLQEEDPIWPKKRVLFHSHFQ